MRRRRNSRGAVSSIVASIVARVLRDPRTSKAAKTAAGLALTQSERRKEK